MPMRTHPELDAPEDLMVSLSNHEVRARDILWSSQLSPPSFPRRREPRAACAGVCCPGSPPPAGMTPVVGDGEGRIAHTDAPDSQWLPGMSKSVTGPEADNRLGICFSETVSASGYRGFWHCPARRERRVGPPVSTPCAWPRGLRRPSSPSRQSPHKRSSRFPSRGVDGRHSMRGGERGDRQPEDSCKCLSQRRFLSWTLARHASWFDRLTMRLLGAWCL